MSKPRTVFFLRRRQVLRKLSACAAVYFYASAYTVAQTAAPSVGESSSEKKADNTLVYETDVTIIGSDRDLQTSESASDRIATQDITRFESSDLNQILASTPGVYVREEDGFGLRPNIGLRGTDPDRSAKISLLEDGILIGPAPYAAPAAYYVPNVARMRAVEIVKGAEATRFGPHNVGGAINFITASFNDYDPIRSPNQAFGNTRGEISITAGSFSTYLAEIRAGSALPKKEDKTSIFFDGLYFGSEGFKDIDGSSTNTGFDRSDSNIKIAHRFDTVLPQSVTLKLGYSDEDSNETYLGLTDDDFADDEDRRYGISEQDGFVSDHTQAQLFHTIELSDRLEVNSKAYIHRFDRNWQRVNGFANCINNEIDLNCLNLQSVLARPDIFTNEYDLISGNASSDPNDPRTQIDLRRNDRRYGSFGLEFGIEAEYELFDLANELVTSIRYHEDYVERRQRSQAFLIENGTLGPAAGQSVAVDTNDAEAEAFAFTLANETIIGDVSVELSARIENVDYQFTDFLEGDPQLRSNASSHTLFSPSIGLGWQIDSGLDELIIIAGIAKGFSAPSASAGDEVDPEEAINTEFGARLAHESKNGAQLNTSAIGFVSDYRNLLGRCRDSDTSCELGEETNAGEAKIYGLEFSAGWRQNVTDTVLFRTELDYTYTKSEFETSFTSSIPGLRNVRAGDELTYRPEHQAALQIGIDLHELSLDLRANGRSGMRELAGQGDTDPAETIPSLFTSSLGLTWRVATNTELKFIVDNIADTRKKVSRRPLGARPNAPRTFKLNASYRF